MRPRPPTAVEDVASSQALLSLVWVRSESFEQRSRHDGSGGVWAIHRCQLLIDMSRWRAKSPLRFGAWILEQIFGSPALPPQHFSANIIALHVRVGIDVKLVRTGLFDTHSARP